MELMDRDQIDIMLGRLIANSVIVDALEERATSCGLAPYNEYFE